MKSFALAAAGLALAISAPAAAQKANVEKVGPAGGRILTAAKVGPKATTVYLSGNLASPITPGGSDYGDTKTQTISTLNKIKALLAEHGMTMKDIVRMDAYLVAAPGMDGKMDFAGFNAGFAEFFGTTENPTTTTRTTMQVAALAGPQFLVELTVIAAK
jgi:enamine deaminase RidA (YjgF/YER057c/UK114 family)